MRQNGTTSDMVFSIPYLISYISQYFTLNPGDLVLTGTPAGVGSVQPGDVISAGLGDLLTMKFPVAQRKWELDIPLSFSASLSLLLCILGLRSNMILVLMRMVLVGLLCVGILYVFTRWKYQDQTLAIIKCMRVKITVQKLCILIQMLMHVGKRTYVYTYTYTYKLHSVMCTYAHIVMSFFKLSVYLNSNIIYQVSRGFLCIKYCHCYFYNIFKIITENTSQQWTNAYLHQHYYYCHNYFMIVITIITVILQLYIFDASRAFYVKLNNNEGN